MFGLFKSIAEAFFEPNIGPDVNPATGLPMLDSNIDTAGNPFGLDNQNSMFSDSSNFGSLTWQVPSNRK